MPGRLALRCLASTLTAASVLSGGALLGSSAASAQVEPSPTTIELGEWTLRPRLELFMRGEVTSDAIVGAGDVYQLPVQADGPGEASPLVERTVARIETQWFARTRARLGIDVAYGPVRGVLTLQDARVLGDTSASTVALSGSETDLPFTAPYEAFIELTTDDAPELSFRLGRQEVVWGDGRLIGRSDRSATGRSLDAARGGLVLGDFEAELLAVLLAAPGALPPEVGRDRIPEEGTGAQLYGARSAYHFLPWLSAELVGLARVVRPPAPDHLTPGDTYVLDGRVFGDHRGLRYALEGAGQLGRVASFGENRDLAAFALAARAELETALLWHLTFGVEGAYASGAGEETAPTETQRRFDPILPESHENHSRMALYAWSNLIEVAGLVKARPMDEVSLDARYAFVGLADPKGRWTTANLVPVGADRNNDSSVIGHAVELGVGWIPYQPLSFGAAYGLLVLGDGGANILESAGRGRPEAAHWGMLEAELRL